MIALATANLTAGEVVNFEVRQVDSEKIPYPDETFSVVISNGVINLLPDKPTCFAEIYRVLRPGGQLLFADVIREHDLPAALAAAPEAWSQ